ncbi:MAG TPA: sigma-70 family RNA polymerase sigma factor [Puia sp.]|jgi:RNA polymerase sigma-70 factor (ECF subfamily)|nr:sigma-70 family RNA polymerase sigma factor [Puia sp.]
MEQQELIPHLFRTEYRKIVSVLCKRFGIDQMEIAEDIASETFLTAAQTWGMKGIPPHPVAWLYHVARNRAFTYLQRDNVFKSKISPEIKKTTAGVEEQEIDLSPKNIEDSQLQMMFTICHPAISPEAQIGLSLRILCGFGIDEIADAFLSNKETINKRLFRAKEKLREEKINIEIPDAREIDKRLATVLTTIYLLFTEGYYSVGGGGGIRQGGEISGGRALRKELCFEAMRLCRMLVDNPLTDKPAVNALLSLMCFHASRLEARVDEYGEIVLYDDQDTSRWDAGLISEGGYFLRRSASGAVLSKYHLEANIAYWHCVKEDTPEKWENVLQLYNRLLQLEYSPIAALNRTFALSKTRGKRAAIVEAEKLKLAGNPFYFALLGELYSGVDDGKAMEHLQKAFSLAKTAAEKQLLQKKLGRLRGNEGLG